jgi:ribosomal-protein-alanine N-acetyltransferase
VSAYAEARRAIRRCGRSDSAVLAAIHAASFEAQDAWSRDVFDLQLALANVFGLVDGTNGLILLRVAADEAEVLTLAVVPAGRRRGSAHALLLEASSIAASFGARSLFLEVSVTNIAGRALYTKFGFIQAGRRPRYYSDGSDALVLRLDLPAPDRTGEGAC